MNNTLKISVLKILLQNKNILFGKFSETLTHEMKVNKWKEVADQAKSLNALDSNKDWKHFRDTIWQNWRKRTIEKIDNRKRTGSGGSKKCIIDESDKIILEILGKDSPIIEGLPVPEPSGDDTTATQIYVLEEDNFEIPRKKRHRLEETSRSQQDNTKHEFEKKILEVKLKILERECYLKELEILGKERELKLSPSIFTKKLCEERQPVKQNDILSQALNDALAESDETD